MMAEHPCLIAAADGTEVGSENVVALHTGGLLPLAEGVHLPETIVVMIDVHTTERNLAERVGTVETGHGTIVWTETETTDRAEEKIDTNRTKM